MANISPATVTITSTIGPGITATATVFTNVVGVEVDFEKNTLKVRHAGGRLISYYDYSAIATITWTVASGASTLAFS